MRKIAVFTAAFAAIVVCASALAQTPQLPTPQQAPPVGPMRVPSPNATTPDAGSARRVVDSPTLVRTDFLRQSFPAMRGLALPVVVSMRTPNVGNVYLSSSSATFSAGPLNSRPGAPADGELTLRTDIGAGLSVHIRSPADVAYAVEFEGDTGEWSPEYEIRYANSAGQLTGSSGARGYASMVGLNQWLIAVPAASNRSAAETVVSIRAPWDHNDRPRANLRFRRATVTPVNQ